MLQIYQLIHYTLTGNKEPICTLLHIMHVIMTPFKSDSLKLSFLRLQPDFSDVLLYTYGYTNYNLYKAIHAWKQNLYRCIHEHTLLFKYFNMDKN
jgi:hypothetical protein